MKKPLEEIADELKSQFFGIDEVIDEIIKSIEVWYEMPDLLDRPVIITLISNTGMGKTDLVRKLVDKLGFTDKYFETVLTHDRYSDNIATKLAELGLSSNVPKIMMFDEFQKFRTIDKHGDRVNEEKHHDIWDLLSDGSVSSEEILNSLKYNKIAILNSKLRIAMQEAEDEEEIENKNLRNVLRFYRHDISFLLNLLGKDFNIGVDELAELSRTDLEKKVNDLYEQYSRPMLHSKSLIFICANIDDLYYPKNSVADSATDADLHFERVSDINIIDAKKALTGYFTPEQISRLGNNLIVYKSLKEKDFINVIKKRLSEIAKKCEVDHGISVSFSNSVVDFIYRNGVFPTQGVRPVLTTIQYEIENSIPKLLFNAKKSKVDSVVCYVDGGKVHYTNNDTNIHTYKLSAAIDSIKKSVEQEEILVTSIHEAGHITAHVLLFNKIPQQMTSNSGSGGFVIHSNTKLITNHISRNTMKCGLAGYASEEIIFGKVNTTNGSLNDFDIVYDDAIKHFRNSGWTETGIVNIDNRRFNTDRTDSQIIRFVNELYTEIKCLLLENKALLSKIADMLVEKHTIHPIELKEILLRDFNISASVNDKIICDFTTKYEDWKKENNIK